MNSNETSTYKKKEEINKVERKKKNELKFMLVSLNYSNNNNNNNHEPIPKIEKIENSA